MQQARPVYHFLRPDERRQLSRRNSWKTVPLQITHSARRDTPAYHQARLHRHQKGQDSFAPEFPAHHVSDVDDVKAFP